jgi:hypothetical protein
VVNVADPQQLKSDSKASSHLAASTPFEARRSHALRKLLFGSGSALRMIAHRVPDLVRSI